MNRLQSIRSALNLIRESEGPAFIVQEENIEGDILTYEAANSNLIIRVLTFLGAQMASGFFMSFLVMMGLHKHSMAMLLVGFFLVLLAIILNRTVKEMLVETGSVAIIIIGYILIGIGCVRLHLNYNIIANIFILLSVLVIAYSKNSINTFLALLMIATTVIWMIFLNKNYVLLHVYNAVAVGLMVYLHLSEAKLISGKPAIEKLYGPLRSGMDLAVLMGLMSVSNLGTLPPHPVMVWISSILPIAAVLYLIMVILKLLKLDQPETRILVLAISAILLALTAVSPGISGAILLLLLNFRSNFKMGIVIGMLALAVFLYHFYYNLNYTLLVKSVLLFSSGILFFVFYFLSAKKLSADEKV